MRPCCKNSIEDTGQDVAVLLESRLISGRRFGGLVASIHREIHIRAHPDVVWAALRDVGAIHQRLAPGFVTDVRLEEGARVVTFGNGMVARELIVDVDDQRRRLVWAAVGGRMTHHNASAQVFADGEGSTRFVWIADLLPHEIAPAIAGMMDEGLAVIKRTLESTSRREP
jgi:carbon monoxide dehydrogenase subunit G